MNQWMMLFASGWSTIFRTRWSSSLHCLPHWRVALSVVEFTSQTLRCRVANQEKRVAKCNAIPLNSCLEPRLNRRSESDGSSAVLISSCARHRPTPLRWSWSDTLLWHKAKWHSWSERNAEWHGRVTRASDTGEWHGRVARASDTGEWHGRVARAGGNITTVRQGTLSGNHRPHGPPLKHQSCWRNLSLQLGAGLATEWHNNVMCVMSFHTYDSPTTSKTGPYDDHSLAYVIHLLDVCQCTNCISLTIIVYRNTHLCTSSHHYVTQHTFYTLLHLLMSLCTDFCTNLGIYVHICVPLHHSHIRVHLHIFAWWSKPVLFN